MFIKGKLEDEKKQAVFFFFFNFLIILAIGYFSIFISGNEPVMLII